MTLRSLVSIYFFVQGQPICPIAFLDSNSLNPFSSFVFLVTSSAFRQNGDAVYKLCINFSPAFILSRPNTNSLSRFSSFVFLMTSSCFETTKFGSSSDGLAPLHRSPS
jgi:hypothetical protein